MASSTVLKATVGTNASTSLDAGSVSGAATVVAADGIVKGTKVNEGTEPEPIKDVESGGKDAKDKEVTTDLEDPLKPRRSQAKRQWSITAVKGKVTTSCLMNACKALTFGIFLIFVGAAMATLGYYASEEQLLLQQLNQTEVTYDSSAYPKNWRPPQIVSTGNNNITNSTTSGPRTVPRRTSYVLTSFGLNKLAYVGPIVMGVGGFVIVAACVMTFEARDSAAKIVPARFRKPFPETARAPEESNVRHTSAQTKWQTLGVCGNDFYRIQQERGLSRRAMTSAFIRFSKHIQSSMDSSADYYDRAGSRVLIKCPSAPSLVKEFHQEGRRLQEAPRILRVSAFPKPPPRRRLSSNAYPRQTMSVDNPAVRECYATAYPSFIGEKGDEDMELGASATRVHRTDSDGSLALDLHLPQCAVTLSIRDSSRSPSGNAETDEQIEVVAGPSESVPVPIEYHIVPPVPKVDKQTSTSDHLAISMLGWSVETGASKDGRLSTKAVSGGSFREAKKSRNNRKVKRSETIDTASAKHHKPHVKSHHSRSRTDSVHSPTGKSTEDRKLAPSRSEIGRRHQLSRQPKIEATDCTEKTEAHIV